MAGAIPKNRARFSLREVAEATSGTLSGSDAEVTGVSTDTRTDLTGQLFIALRGERFDAHDFAREAVSRGASALVVERDIGAVGVPVVRVASTWHALGDLARQHRRRWGKRVVAVAGSAGKTTTRSTVSALLEYLEPGRVHFASGNLNNLVGVPLVLLGLEAEHETCVVEIGTNASGEVRRLALVAEPNLAVLTLIGLEHCAGLGGLDEIAREEGAIFSGLAPGGVAIGNADDARVMHELDASTVSKRVRYGRAPAADYRLVGRSSAGPLGSRLSIVRRAETQALEVELPLLGDAGAYAALAALAVAESSSKRRLSGADISAAFARVGEPGRLCAIELGEGTILLDDSYNSNPPSLRSSLAAAAELARARAARLVLVIGEMRELGAQSAQLHTDAARDLLASGAAVLIAVGGDAELFVSGVRGEGIDALFVADAAAALGVALGRIRPGDVVLIKASRGIHAEEVVSGLLRAKGRAA